MVIYLWTISWGFHFWDAVHFIAFFKDVGRISSQLHAGIPFKPTVVLMYYVFCDMVFAVSTRMHVDDFSNANKQNHSE